jgi:hypothetical protein
MCVYLNISTWTWRAAVAMTCVVNKEERERERESGRGKRSALQKWISGDRRTKNDHQSRSVRITAITALLFFSLSLSVSLSLCLSLSFWRRGMIGRGRKEKRLGKEGIRRALVQYLTLLASQKSDRCDCVRRRSRGRYWASSVNSPSTTAKMSSASEEGDSPAAPVVVAVAAAAVPCAEQ